MLGYLQGDPIDNKRLSTDSKRGRKRALSTTGLVKNLKIQNTQKAIGGTPKPRMIKGKGEAVFYYLLYKISVF